MTHALPDPEVLFDESDGIGWITLNRPRAINALTHNMVREISPMLARWATDDGIRAVVLTGAGERGLCAGGDIVGIYHSIKSGTTEAQDFWRDEYILNHDIATYPKPYLAIMDGIVMGGGVGLAAHGNIRVVTEKSTIGMPEVGIGFIPDVGGSHLLAHAPGQLGTHVALTTTRMSAADAIALGFADHYLTSDVIADFLAALRTTEPAAAVARFATTAPASELLAQRPWIDKCYAGDTVAEIIGNLQDFGSAESAAAAEQIMAKSPTAVAVALASLRQAARSDSLAETLNREYRVSLAALASPDLAEGIRAQVIDKDRNPAWSPAILDDVAAADVDAYFSHLGARELGLGH